MSLGVLVLAGGNKGFNEESYIHIGNEFLLQRIVNELSQMQLPVVVATSPEVYQSNIFNGEP